MARTFSSVAATPAEQQAARPGDDIIARPDVVMDRAFTVAAPPAAVPRRRRAARDIHPAWQHLNA
jgi:hypothetical protein